MDYAEIIEPLDKYEHRTETIPVAPPVLKAERPKPDVSAKVAKVERASRVERADKAEGLRHDRTEKSEKTERSATKAEKKRASGVEREAPASSAPPPADAATAAETASAPEQPAAPARNTATAEEWSPGSRPLLSRLSKLQRSDAVRSPSLEFSTGGDTSQEDASAPPPALHDASVAPRIIKNCYIRIEPLDMAQYMCNGRLIDSDSTDTGADWSAGASTSTSGAHSLAPPPAPPAPPSDPTELIESQLALLDEMSSHATRTAHRGSDAEEASPAGPCLHDEASVSTVASDGAPSAPSDAEHHLPSTSHGSGSKRARVDERLAAATAGSSGGCSAVAEDCDKDSVSSSDVAQEGGDCFSKATKRKPRKRKRKNEASEHIVFEAHRGPILDVKTVGRHVLAACEDGNVYCYSLKSGKLKRQYSGHTAAVICLAILEREGPDGEDPVPEFLYTGSLDQLRCFQFKTGALINYPVNLGKPMQCMDENWGTIFVGTKTGEIAKFYTKSFKLNEDYLRCSKENIMALKATKEGARKIVIVAARNEPVTIRDANSGLLMRVIGHNLPHTVYSLLLDSSLLYCGTKTGKIPVFSFATGEEVCKYNAGFGVVCMRIYNHLLFAGCYDGNIYIYSTQDKSLVSCVNGPGKMLLCLDVVKNRIIAGSKDKLKAWPLPPDVKSCIRESRHR